MKNKEIEELLNNIKDKYSYEPYDMTGNVYTTISYEEGQLLLSYIEQLEKKVDQYENPDDLTLFYMWLDTKAKDKMKQLEKRNKQLYEGFMATQEELTDYAIENEQLENNRDKAIEFIENHFLYHYGSYKAPIVFEDNYIQKIVDILKGDSDDKK